MKSCLTLVICLAIISNVFPKAYHVNGKSTSIGKGSPENPFKTISQAAAIMKPGDTCYIHEGTYRESLQPKHSGTALKPIVFMAYKNDIVIISGTEKVSGWEIFSGNIYKLAKVKMSLGSANNLYFNTKKMQLARWPNDTDNNPYTLDAKYIDIAKGTWSMSFISNNEIPDMDWSGGSIHYLGAHSGCSWQRTITNYNKDLHRVYFDTLPNHWPFGTTHHPGRFENGHRGIFYLFDTLGALDAPGEWYYNQNNDTLYFYAPDGNNPENNEVEIAVRQTLAKLDTNYVHLHNLNFFGGMVTITGNNNQLIQCMIKHAGERLITNIKGASLQDAAIQILGANNTIIKKCVLEDGALNGVYIDNAASHSTVENCIIQNFNTVGLHALLINSQGEHTKIIGNSLSGSARDGAKVTGNYSEFAYNHVQKCLLSGADGGLFYVTGNSIPKKIELHHNWFHDAYASVHAGYKAAGIYLDNNSAGYSVHHNVVWNVEWGGLNFNWNAIQNTIYNNTFWNVGIPKQPVINSWVPIKNGVQTNVRNNKLYNNLSDVRPWWLSGDGPKYRVDEKEYLGPEADNDFKNNQQYATRPFISFANKNFMPYKDAPTIDTGIAITGITDNFVGKAPDVGAYEYGGNYWQAGINWEPVGFAWKPKPDYLSMGNDVGKATNSKVTFPMVSAPIQITKNNKEHFFASYYGINSFSSNQKYATVLETETKDRIPVVGDTATLGLVNIESQEFKPLATTRAWNFQQGCMAHWLATSPDSLIIFNDLRNDKYVSVILNVHTKKEIRVIDKPISAVSPDGKTAISINFSRLGITRKAYGYPGEGQDPQENVQSPDNDGLFIVNLATGESKLIVRISQIKDLIHDYSADDIVYFNHTLISRDGSKIFWLARTLPSWKTSALTANIDGTDIKRCFPNDWGGSHFDWLSDNELMVTAKYETSQYAHILFTAGKNNYKRLGNGLLDYDGHGTFSPNGKWMVTDTYPSKNGEQNIFLMHMETAATLPLGRYTQPSTYSGGWRCDIHCRWSPKGDIIGFNSTHTGSRQAYIVKLRFD